jgi:hypothetical protein
VCLRAQLKTSLYVLVNPCASLLLHVDYVPSLMTIVLLGPMRERGGIVAVRDQLSAVSF